MRGVQIEVAAQLVTETCCRSDCGILFAVPSDWQQRRRKDHSSFFCPNGHSQSYTSKSEEEKLREQLQEVEASRTYYRRRSQTLAEDNMSLARSRSAMRGQVTRLKNKAAAGECAFCHQQFPDVAHHVATEHTGVSTDADEGEAE